MPARFRDGLFDAQKLRTGKISRVRKRRKIKRFRPTALVHDGDRLAEQERFVELDALTDSPSAIPTGTLVQVVRVTDQGVLVVRPMG